MYKAYCTDLDGTLFNSKGNLSEENERAINEIHAMGVHFVPTSGRTINEMPKSLVENPAIRYIIYSNGAGVIDKETGKRSEELINEETAAKILDVLREFPSLLVIHKDTECYIDGVGVKKSDDYKINSAYLEIFKYINVVNEDFDSYVRASGSLEMIVAFFGKTVNERECIERLSRIEGIYITSSTDGNIEIISALANKGNGVRRFAKMAGVALSEIVATGDGKNDIALLESAGLPLAASNAKPELKAYAKDVICSSDEHVAKYVLDNYLRK